MDGSRPEVSVCLITYNHERFIGQAIESVLAQRKPFAWELIIAEDCSSDQTRAITKAYAERHPDRIRLILPPANTRAMVWVEMIASARGAFVAYLDGDDFWTDPEKLVRQRSFLEAHPDCAMVAHAMEVVDEESGRRLADHRPRAARRFYTLDDLAEHGTFFSNSSVMYRGACLPPGGPDPAVTRMGDWLLHMSVARHGKVGFLDERMATYRRHGTSRSVSNRRNVEGMLHDLLYSLREARRFGASERAVRRGEARAHLLGALSALDQGAAATFRQEIAASVATGERISRMQQILSVLRGMPRLARLLVGVYARLSRQR